MKGRAAAIAMLTITGFAGCGDDSPLPPGPQGPMDAAGTVTLLGDLYEAKSLAGFTALLSEDFVFVRDRPDRETGATEWNAAEELALHARLFDPASIPASDAPLPNDLWLEAVNITLTPIASFAERTDLYTAANPQGALDPNRWIARGATYATDAHFFLRGSEYGVLGRVYFVILEDRSKLIGDAGEVPVISMGRSGLAQTLGEPCSPTKHLVATQERLPPRSRHAARSTRVDRSPRRIVSNTRRDAVLEFARR